MRNERIPGFAEYTTGRFDATEEYSFFIATGPSQHEEISTRLPQTLQMPYPYLLVAVNDMKGDKEEDFIDRVLDESNVLLDSGIFNLTMKHARAHDMTMDEALILTPDEVDGFGALYDRYCHLASRFNDRLWGVIELDLGGPLVKPETRRRIVADTGITPIPVIHPRSDGWAYYDQHASTYDRVCVGNLVNASPSDRVMLLHALEERARRLHPNTWHHLLGVTPSALTYALPIRGSSDSSTWSGSVRWMQGWRSETMGWKVGHFSKDYWYLAKKYIPEGEEGESNFYEALAMAMVSAHAAMMGVRDARREYAA